MFFKICWLFFYSHFKHNEGFKTQKQIKLNVLKMEMELEVKNFKSWNTKETVWSSQHTTSENWDEIKKVFDNSFCKVLDIVKYEWKVLCMWFLACVEAFRYTFVYKILFLIYNLSKSTKSHAMKYSNDWRSSKKVQKLDSKRCKMKETRKC